MPIRFHIDTAGRRVHAVGEDPVTDEDLLDYQLALADHEDHGAGFDQLVDLRASAGLTVTATGIQSAGLLTNDYDDHVRGTKCAIVVGGTWSLYAN